MFFLAADDFIKALFSRLLPCRSSGYATGVDILSTGGAGGKGAKCTLKV